jgi:hypothetical protein
MRRSSVITSLCLTVIVSGGVYAEEEVGWRDAQGKPIPESDSLRFAHGLLEGNRHNVAAGRPPHRVQGEAFDIESVWVVKVRLTDTVRPASVDLVATFTCRKP